MDQIVLDDVTLAALDKSGEPTEIVDSHGRILGVYAPVKPKRVSDVAEGQPHPSQRENLGDQDG